MALKTFVKVGCITNLSDARYCAAMGADMLGFCVIEGQEGFISPKEFQEIRGWITGPKVVAEIYGIAHIHVLNTLLENYRPDFLEMGVADFNQLKTLSLPYILSLKKGEAMVGSPEYVLTDKQFESPIHTSKRLIVIESKEDVSQILEHSEIYGIALKGGNELSPGLKEYQELSEVFELLETDD